MDSELKNLIGEFEKIAKETKKVEVVDENKVDTSTPDNSVQNLMSELSTAFKESKKKITPKKIKVQESDLTDFFSVIKEAKKEVPVIEIAKWPDEQPPEEYEEPKIKIEEVESLFSGVLGIVEAPRIPRKKGQPAGSDSHSDLYTDENPKGTIQGLKFATVKDAKASVSKIEGSGKSHAHKVQAAIAMEQRAKEMGKTAQAGVYRTYIEKMKKITKQKNEDLSEDVIVGFEEASDEDIIKTYAEQIKNTAPKLIGKPQQHDVYETDLSNLEGLKQEFVRFKARTIEQLGSLGGGGEVLFSKLDDVDISGQEDGDVLTFNSSTGNYELKSSTSTVSDGQLLEETDGSNIVFSGTDASGSDEGDDVLLESGVGGSRDLDQNVLQVLTTDIIPQQGGKFNLGSATHRFKNIFLEANTIDLDGALIKSDGSGQITISAEGATLPVGSKDTDGKELVVSVAQTNSSGVLTAQATKTVPLFTQASGLSTSAASFTFAKVLSRRSVYTNSGHTFLLSSGDDRADLTVELFEF